MMLNTRTFEQGMVELHVPQGVLGRYCGFEPSRVSRALSGELTFTPEEAKTVEQTVAAMHELQREVRPQVPINWQMIGLIRPLVDARKQAARDKADPVASNFVAVRVNSTSYFECIHSGQVLTKPDPVSAAGFWMPSEGEKVAATLKERFGIQARIEIIPIRRRRSELQTLFSVGIEELAEVAQ